ncbi:MAG: biosynthetic-type acetolactate synthase large subunit, partial [Eubacteriaceae bacterium]|nr:biosynthetic-type acetolactate synthase large subunit [Eubacteriaceae bacterium]
MKLIGGIILKLSGAQILINVLLEHNVNTVFGFPGGTVLTIYDELYKAADKIKHYTTCHEQGAVHAADGYARASGKAGVVIATSGPGATNLVTGIACAYLDSSPIVAITGNVACENIGKDSFQEVDIVGVTMPITKHSFIVKDVNILADVLREAFYLAKSGRPGPVLVDIPKDVQTALCEYEKSSPVPYLPNKFTNSALILTAAEMINNSSRPYLYIGGGAVLSDATEEIVTLSEKISSPIGSSLMGIGSVASSHPNYLGMTGMHGVYASSKAMQEADLVIAVGARFSDRTVGDRGRFSQNKKVIHIDIDKAEISKNVSAQVALVGSIKDILADITALVHKRENPQWQNEINEYKQKSTERTLMRDEKLTPEFIIKSLNELSDDNLLIATDVGQHQMWAAQYCDIKKPRTFITSGGLGAMGFGMGAAIGASISKNKARTVLYTSDGSFHMNLSELA